MGLKEQITAGSTNLKRDTIQLNVSGDLPRYTGSFTLGRTFNLISVQSVKPCRIRLYGDAVSRNNTGELIRPFVSQSVISSSIALIADIDLNTTDIYNLTPSPFGLNLDNPVSTSIYYTIDTSSAAPFGVGGNSLTFTRFLLEDPTIVNLPGIISRETNTIYASSLVSNASVTGSLTTPRTYLLYSFSSSINPVRVRLYTREEYRDNPTEAARVFTTEPNSGSGLIADIYCTETASLPMAPVLLGRNDDDLNVVQDANQITYYRLENLTAGTYDFTASLGMFSLED